MLTFTKTDAAPGCPAEWTTDLDVEQTLACGFVSARRHSTPEQLAAAKLVLDACRKQARATGVTVRIYGHLAPRGYQREPMRSCCDFVEPRSRR